MAWAHEISRALWKSKGRQESLGQGWEDREIQDRPGG